MPRVRTALKVLVALTVASLLALAVVVTLFYKLYPIRTYSMTPTLPLKALAVVEKDASYQQGDIITYRHGTEIITHRFIKRDANGDIITKGDANPSPDAWPVQDQDVIGKEVLCIPWAGFALFYLMDPFGLGSLVLLGVALWLLWPDRRRAPSAVTP